MLDTLHGMSRVSQVLADRSARIRELKAQGKKAVGYFCSYVPVEILTAMDLIPVRILGDMDEPVTEMDTVLPTSFCPFLRNCINTVFRGRYDFLDGVVGAHSCDAQEKSIHVWKSKIKYEFYHYLDMPATLHPWGADMYRSSLEKFKSSCEAWTGKPLSGEALEASILAHNRHRSLVRELYELKRFDPPLVSGSDTLRILTAISGLPVDDGSALLEAVIQEARAGKIQAGTQDKKRILVVGACLDALPLIRLIEDFDADVVMDDNCMGARTYFRDVSITKDPMQGLASRYLNLTCARTFRETVAGEFRKDHAADLKTRFAHLGNYIEKWRVEGVVIQLVRFCDPFGYEVPELKDYLDSINIPNLYLETEYTTGSLAPLKTRLQTFLETLL